MDLVLGSRVVSDGLSQRGVQAGGAGEQDEEERKRRYIIVTTETLSGPERGTAPPERVWLALQPLTEKEEVAK